MSLVIESGKTSLGKLTMKVDGVQEEYSLFFEMSKSMSGFLLKKGLKDKHSFMATSSVVEHLADWVHKTIKNARIFNYRIERYGQD